MGRIASDENRTLPKLVSDQPASVPVLSGDDVVAEVRPDAEDGADAGVAVDGIEIQLAWPQIIMHQPSLAAIDRIYHSGAAGIDDAGAPRRHLPLTTYEVGRANERRLHAL